MMATLNASRNTLEHKLRKRLEDIELKRQRAAIRMRKDEMGLQMLLFKMTQQFGDYACLDTPEDVRAELKKGIRRSIMAAKEDKANEKAIATAAAANDPNAPNPIEAAQEAAVQNDGVPDPGSQDGSVDESLNDQSGKTKTNTREMRNRKRRRLAAAAASQMNRPERPSYKKLREKEDIDRAKLNSDSFTGLMSVYRPSDKEEYRISRWLDQIYPAGNNMSATICGLKKRMMRKEIRDLVNKPKPIDTENIKHSLSVGYFPEIVKYKPRTLKVKHKKCQLNITNSSDSSGYSSERCSGEQTRHQLSFNSHSNVDPVEDNDLTDEERDVFPADEYLHPPSMQSPKKTILKLPNIKGVTESTGHKPKKVSIRSPDPSEISESLSQDNRPFFITTSSENDDEIRSIRPQIHRKNVLDEYRQQSNQSNVPDTGSKQSEMLLDNQKPPLPPISKTRNPPMMPASGEVSRRGSVVTLGEEKMARRPSITGSEAGSTRRASIVVTDGDGNGERRKTTTITNEGRRRSSIGLDTMATARRASLTVHSSRRPSVIVNVDSVTGDNVDEAALEKEWNEVKKCRYIRGYEPPEMRTPNGVLVDYVFHKGDFEGSDEFEKMKFEAEPEESPEESPPQ
ncbi:uncharacterized protein LOC141907335 [Tubulanus polymorphus]|uniref:uncharacterized protein LOC141907335 n=1 Tax=Tubulanus polymorphus TaxID=672921 RepID=UPI003DA2E99A